MNVLRRLVFAGLAMTCVLGAGAPVFAQTQGGYVFSTDSGYFRFIGNRIEGAFPRDTQDISQCATDARDPSNGNRKQNGSRTIHWGIVHQFRMSGIHDDDDYRVSVVIDVPPGQEITEKFVDRMLQKSTLNIARGLGQVSSPEVSVKPATMSLRDGRLTFVIRDSKAVALLKRPRNVSVRYSWCFNYNGSGARQVPIEYSPAKPSRRHKFETVSNDYSGADSNPTQASLIVSQIIQPIEFGLRFKRLRTTIPINEPANWLSAMAYRVPLDSFYSPLVMSVEVDSNVVVFIASSDTTGRVQIEPVRARHPHGRPLSGESPPLIGNVPRCAKGQSWIAAFFIEGVGNKPTQPVYLSFNSESGRTLIAKVDPARNFIRMKPVLEFHNFDLAPDSGTRVFSLSASVPSRKTTTNRMIPLMLNRSADGWSGGARQYRTSGLFSASVTTFTSSSLDPWFVYSLINPNNCD
jgi:hypothetical protein